ncbi:MAG TPA: TatD family hydrolase [Candidatus Pacearchaeota archaeon]|nr:TatD family hydrolase [Candidatus Pacearchaeota archaeon]
MIDTHAHLNFSQFDKDRKEIIDQCLGKGISLINVGTDYQNSEQAVALAKEYEKGVWASIGLHPLDVNQGFDYEKYKSLGREKIKAIGETGLDYWFKPGKEKKEKQQNVFLKHIVLAEELKLPLIIHCRVAFADVYSILKETKVKGVLHCFTGALADLEKFLALGYFIGFNGIIFKMDLKKAIAETPLERMLLETDCPFLSPPGFDQRNSPLSLEIIGKEIARIKGISLEEVLTKTESNALGLFK